MTDPKSEDRPGLRDTREPWERRGLIDTVRVLFTGAAWPHVRPFVSAAVVAVVFLVIAALAMR